MALGIGIWRAFLQRRGATGMLGELPFRQMSGGRRLSEMSNAETTCDVPDPNGSSAARAVRALLGSAEAWEHELSLWRDSVEVWVGPITEPDPGRDDIVIRARDLFQWFERRLLEEDLTHTDEDLAAIFADYAVTALARDDSPNISFNVGSAGMTTSRAVAASPPSYASDEMRSLAREGVEFTMLGRTLYVAAEIPSALTLPKLTNEWFVPDRSPRRGIDMASEWVVQGATLAGQTVVGRAGGIDERYGLVQQRASENSIVTEAGATQAAESRYAHLGRPPRSLTGQLLPEAPVEFANLVPGVPWEVEVSIGVHHVAATMRLSSVDFGQSPEGGERITIGLVPVQEAGDL